MIFFCLFPSSCVVVVALLGLLGGRDEVGRVGRHGELFLDAGDHHGTSDSAGFYFDWEDIPSFSFSYVSFLHCSLCLVHLELGSIAEEPRLVREVPEGVEHL